jgi:peptidyl-prolyl cis-trans isomerase C
MKHLFAIAILAVALTARAEDKPAVTHKPDEVVARVGDHAIKWQELDLAVAGMSKQFAAYGRAIPPEQTAQLRYDILQQMVTHELALQEARGHEPADLDELIKQQTAQAKEQIGGEEALKKALSEMGVSMEEYAQRTREDILVRERIRQIAEAQAKVTPEEVKSFFDNNRDKMKVPERVRVSHILIQVPKDATDEVKKQKRTQIESVQTLLKGGEKFADTARKFSEDKLSAINGGDLNYFARGRMVPEFEQVAFALKTNQVSDVVTTKFGYHLLLVTDHQPAGDRTFEDAKSDIEKYLRSTKEQEVAAAHIKKLHDTGKFEILIPKPEPVAVATPPVAAPSKPLPTVETKPVAAPKP